MDIAKEKQMCTKYLARAAAYAGKVGKRLKESHAASNEFNDWLYAERRIEDLLEMLAKRLG
jgi:hypothetical protein